MIKKEELESRVLNCYEYEIITEGEYLPQILRRNEGLMYETFGSKEEFKVAFYKHNKGKTSINAMFHLVWSSDYLNFNKDITGDFIYVKPPEH